MLRYMHCVCSPPMAHGNLKASNILFDAELTPHVSDGGLTVLGCLFDTNPKVILLIRSQDIHPFSFQNIEFFIR